MLSVSISRAWHQAWRTRIVSCLCVALLLASHAASQSPAPSSSAGTSSVKDAAAAIASGDFTKAESELRLLLRTVPNNAHALNLLGIICAQQKRESEAETLFKQAIAIQPDFAGAHASLGLLYVQMGKNDLAIAPLQEALRLDPGRSDARTVLVSVWRDQAHAAAQQNELEKALALLLDARKVNPGDADLQYDLGMVELRMSLFSDAIDAFDQTLKLRADDARALYGLGRAKMAIAKFDEAQQAFERYVQLRPADSSGHYALGFTLQAMEQPAAARTEYEKSIELQPLQTESYFQLGLIDLDTGNLRAAADKFGRVLKRAPQHAGALTELGRVKFQEKEYAEAADLLAKAIASNPNLREAHYYLGMTDARLGHTDDSERELQTASRIEHEEVEKHQNLLKIVDPDQVQTPEQEAKPVSTN